MTTQAVPKWEFPSSRPRFSSPSVANQSKGKKSIISLQDVKEFIAKLPLKYPISGATPQQRESSNRRNILQASRHFISRHPEYKEIRKNILWMLGTAFDGMKNDDAELAKVYAFRILTEGIGLVSDKSVPISAIQSKLKRPVSALDHGFLVTQPVVTAPMFTVSERDANGTPRPRIPPRPAPGIKRKSPIKSQAIVNPMEAQLMALDSRLKSLPKKKSNSQDRFIAAIEAQKKKSNSQDRFIAAIEGNKALETVKSAIQASKDAKKDAVDLNAIVDKALPNLPGQISKKTRQELLSDLAIELRSKGISERKIKSLLKQTEKLLDQEEVGDITKQSMTKLMKGVFTSFFTGHWNNLKSMAGEQTVKNYNRGKVQFNDSLAYQSKSKSKSSSNSSSSPTKKIKKLEAQLAAFKNGTVGPKGILKPTKTAAVSAIAAAAESPDHVETERERKQRKKAEAAQQQIAELTKQLKIAPTVNTGFGGLFMGNNNHKNNNNEYNLDFLGKDNNKANDVEQAQIKFKELQKRYNDPNTSSSDKVELKGRLTKLYAIIQGAGNNNGYDEKKHGYQQSVFKGVNPGKEYQYV